MDTDDAGGDRRRSRGRGIAGEGAITIVITSNENEEPNGSYASAAPAAPAMRSSVIEKAARIVCSPGGELSTSVAYSPSDRPMRDGERILVVPGSWNPPHEGHVALLSTGRFDLRAAMLSASNADKGAIPASDAIHRLRMMQLAMPDSVGLVTSAALLVDQAASLRGMWPLGKITFAIGWDTFARFRDPRYLRGRHAAAMREFFAHHNLIVKTRGPVSYAGALFELKRFEWAGSVTVTEELETKRYSSSDARELLSRDKMPPGLDPKVYQYAVYAGLYRDDQTG